MTQTREYRTIDKLGWGHGPWAHEVDKKQWQDAATGLPCLIVRNPRGGNLCGYVGVPKGHPAHGRDYSWDVTDPVQEAITCIEVHGGLTFARGCSHGEDESRGICHVPDEGESDDVWWFGFDCAHAWDVRPASDKYRLWLEPDARYRTQEYVEEECRKLAKQLAAIGENFS